MKPEPCQSLLLLSPDPQRLLPAVCGTPGPSLLTGDPEVIVSLLIVIVLGYAGRQDRRESTRQPRGILQHFQICGEQNEPG